MNCLHINRIDFNSSSQLLNCLPEELEEKLLEVETLLASLDGRLAFRRWAKRALHTSCETNPTIELIKRQENG